MSKLVTIFGATGAQGGGVLRAMVRDKYYTIRAVTRNPDSEKARALKNLGCEVVAGDMDDADSLVEAITGSCGVFCVTNYWEHLSVSREVQQGKNVINAAKQAGVKHFIFSGLENVKKILGIDCVHCNSKAEVSEYLQAQGMGFTVVQYAAYMENLNGSLPPRKQGEEYVLDITMEGAPMDFVSAEDIGEVVHQIFNDFSQFNGKTIGLTNDKQTIEDYAAIMSRVLGKKVVATKMGVKDYAILPFQRAQELASVFEFYIRGNPDRDLDLCQKLHPKLLTFEQWVEKNKDAFLSLMK